jgi:hypothetical protein
VKGGNKMEQERKWQNCNFSHSTKKEENRRKRKNVAEEPGTFCHLLSVGRRDVGKQRKRRRESEMRPVQASS